MAQAVRVDGAWVEVGPAGLEVRGIRLSAAWLEGLSDQDLDADFGIERKVVAETARPAGVRVLGSTVEDVDGVPTRAWQTEAFDGAAIAAQQAALAAAVQAEAGRRITDLVPVWRQLWLLSLGLNTAILHGLDPADWPAEAQGAYAEGAAEWAAVQAIGMAAGAIIAAIPADPAELAAFDVAGHPAWP